MTGPLVRSSARVNAETSSVNEVSGIGAQMTLRPWSSNGRITSFQQEPSAHAPCVRTMVEFSAKPFISAPRLLQLGVECHLLRGSSSWRKQFLQRASPARNVRYRGTQLWRPVCLSETLRLLGE